MKYELCIGSLPGDNGILNGGCGTGKGDYTCSGGNCISVLNCGRLFKGNGTGKSFGSVCKSTGNGNSCKSS